MSPPAILPICQLNPQGKPMKKSSLAPCIAALALASATATALAKLPLPSDEAKAKSAETAAKAAHTDKVNGYKLCLAQDRLAAQYMAAQKASGKAASAPTATAACADPGVFVYSPPAPPAPPAPPLEAAGAHSPPKTATSPPSSLAPAAEQPKKK